MTLKAVFLALFLPLLAACSLISSDPGVSVASDSEADEYYGTSMIQSGGLSFRTVNFLRGNLMHGKFRADPAKLIKDLEKDCLPVMSEAAVCEMISDISFNAAENRSGDEAAAYYLTSAIYSYRLLFQAGKGDAESDRFDPANCQQLLRYNKSAAKLFEYLRARQLLSLDSYQLTSATGQRVNFQKPVSELPYEFSSYADFVPCSHYSVRNLNLINQRFGIGVPLVVSTSTKNPYKSVRMQAFFPMPATAVLRFSETPSRPFIHAVFQFYDTYITEKIRVGEEPVPLALDYSTPMACLSERAASSEGGNLISYMLNPILGEKSSGLYLLEPYNPRKIPVVFIHGLMSGPTTWISMINALRNHPSIRGNYQFWFYKYSSGNPVLASARPLRDALNAARKELATTPEAQASFDHMVLVGHSMGGLIVRTLMQDDPHYFPEALMGKTWAELDAEMSPSERTELEAFRFEKPPYVKRVVLMAVPHRGSEMAKWSVARIASSLIRVPTHVVQRSAHLIGVITRLTGDEKKWQDMVYTGIDNLDPDNLFIQLLSGSPFASGVPVHSIIGNRDAAGVPGGTDGIVPYSSAHLDGVESELVVKSGHSVQRHPAAIRELLRILRVHLAESEKSGFVSGSHRKKPLLKVAPEHRRTIVAPDQPNAVKQEKK